MLDEDIVVFRRPPTSILETPNFKYFSIRSHPAISRSRHCLHYLQFRKFYKLDRVRVLALFLTVQSSLAEQ